MRLSGGAGPADTERLRPTWRRHDRRPQAHRPSLDLTIDIDATLDEVWHALTTGEGIARWFAPYAAVTPGEGGSVSVGWDPKEMWDTADTVWEPLRHMQTASEMPSKDGRIVRLAVDYFLEAHGGRVRVRLVHSGFDDSGSWDGYIDGLDAGWTFFLFNLKHALERHRGVDRQQTLCTLSHDRARRRDSSSLWREWPAPAAPGRRTAARDACRLALGGVEVDATVAVLHQPRTIAFSCRPGTTPSCLSNVRASFQAGTTKAMVRGWWSTATVAWRQPRASRQASQGCSSPTRLQAQTIRAKTG